MDLRILNTLTFESKFYILYELGSFSHLGALCKHHLQWMYNIPLALYHSAAGDKLPSCAYIPMGMTWLSCNVCSGREAKSHQTTNHLSRVYSTCLNFSRLHFISSPTVKLPTSLLLLSCKQSHLFFLL